MATFTPQIPPSAILKRKDETVDGSLRQTKEQYRKMKELEEARKAGTVPAMVDEEGRDINPHIPQYIAQAPWYIEAAGPTLKHQRPHPERQVEMSSIDDWFQRGVVEGKRATRFRKGACENCGSMTHVKRDCFERPRKIGAKFTGEDIAPDEHVQPDLKLAFDAKRDRWNGYDPSEHKEVVKEFEKLDEARKLIRAEKIRSGQLEETTEEEAEAQEATAPEADPEAAADEDKYAEEADMPGVKISDDSKTRITVRNLRIREDTAKYLFDLSDTSAYYDPKSRSMRDNPFKNTGKSPTDVPFAGENFVRFTGEVSDVNEAQLFAWEAQRRGVDVHTLAEPTKLEILKKEINSRKDTVIDVQRRAILELYGGEEHLNALPKELLLAQSEHYVEYNRKGNVIKGEEPQEAKSSYEEDVHPGNHKSVWGSYWANGEWGFHCCHSTVYNSYCTGEAGIAAVDGTKDLLKENADRLEKKKAEEQFKWQKKEEKSKKNGDESSSGSSSSESSSDSSSESENEVVDEAKKKRQEEFEELVKRKQVRSARNHRRKEKERLKVRARREQLKAEKRGEKVGGDKHQLSSSSGSEDSDSEDDKKKQKKRAKVVDEKEELRKALIKAAEADRRAEELMKMDERSRPYNSRYESKGPTDAEMEAYRMRRSHADDPMANMK